MVPTVPLVPDLNAWPVLAEVLASAASLGALTGILDRFLERRRAMRSLIGQATVPPVRIERKAA